MSDWSKGIIHWQENNTLYISVVFTWDLPRAAKIARWYKNGGFKVIAGGPAVSLMPDYLSGIIDPEAPELSPSPLIRHNTQATRATRGCIRNCNFCAVSRIEGPLREIKNFSPAPIVCDDNFLAASKKHFNYSIDRLKNTKNIDFNQGLDARLLTAHHIEKFKSLDMSKMRFSWDFAGEEKPVISAISKLRAIGFPKRKITIYILINNGETQDEALYRMETLKGLGIRAAPMRYQPLNSLKKNSHVDQNWTDAKLKRFCRYWFKQRYLSHIPFNEFTG